MSQYAVWCHSCNVSFPPGTKRCLHCGTGTSPERPRNGSGPPADVEFMGSAVTFADLSVDARFAQEEPLRDLPAGVEHEQEPARRSALRAGMTVLWMVLLAGGYAWRACSQ